MIAGPGTGRRRARPTRRSAGRPPTRFAEAAAGEGPGDDDDDSDDDEDDDAADVMSLDESEGMPLHAAIEVLQLNFNMSILHGKIWACVFEAIANYF